MLDIIKWPDQQLKKHSVVVPDINGDIRPSCPRCSTPWTGARESGLPACRWASCSVSSSPRVPGDSPRVFINPDILETSIEMEPFEEGCLSIPGIFTDVIRPTSVRVQAWNLKARPFTLTVDGYLARVIQHEFDHLNGIVFLDRIDQKKRQRLLVEYEAKVEA